MVELRQAEDVVGRQLRSPTGVLGQCRIGIDLDPTISLTLNRQFTPRTSEFRPRHPLLNGITSEESLIAQSVSNAAGVDAID